ncbi:MAG: SDR family oxidoreductase [Hoeflea sp.]|uniref:SDR family oxidoreductase n=1 Tax=Hoeflea sp. TaxID=1940281 RepID=UPI001E1147B5|nr:SDR family oxidoreductase [Hoeflea sp.]MBU4528664.1 SDR family oxidoreductase [Alphaproteobacteria bacterium]MBU4545531.1 SDR family oxidoreductase [Alphaproteobacteria bacterium]MBU4552141.1 SDR family oxidoreductase [Alphaproteobacteria bacterium]MBV1726267.1 SDR family oxidoreductase [Hoeflea sp.]MBV1762306.1 SDR family oxidoreductase [Hoeflea sp.]
MTANNQTKTILVTGCSSGIGAYCARALKAEGWHVIASARTEDHIAELNSDGIKAYRLDYADSESIADFFEHAMAATGGRCDALFNNGGYGQVGAVEDLPVDALRAQFEANFFGYHDLTRKVIPVMRAQGHGRIVQCSSILGLVPMRFRGAYNASKHALEGLSVTMALELEGSGIHVSLIEPGAIVSRFRANALRHFHRTIDIESSVHRKDYQDQLRRLKKQEESNSGKLGPEAVYRVLHHALTANRPRYHYAVTREAKLGVIARRLLPARLFYPWLARQT